MELQQAMQTLGLSEAATLKEIAREKRHLLQALHPDKQPADQAEIFARLTQDVIDAAEFLSENRRAKKGTSKKKHSVAESAPVETILFEDGEANGDFADYAESNATLVPFGHSFVSDSNLAIGVRGIDYEYQWWTTDNQGITHEREGSALYIVVMNRMRTPVSSLFMGQISYLVDDRGHQYTPLDFSFYWADEDGKYHNHGEFVAPNSKLDGFLHFPKLRSKSKMFTRYVISGSFRISAGNHEEKFYDIELN